MEHLSTVKQLTQDLLERLGVSGVVSVDLDETASYRVHIETEETGLLIGFHGRTLESLQIILSLVVSRALSNWAKVYVNVGDYREKREESLMHLATRAAERAIAIGREVELPHLSASERRVVHLTLSGDERVMTESVGEGDRRILVVKPRS